MRLSDARDEHFDVVLLVHVLEHIDDAPALLKSLPPLARSLIVEVPDFEANPLNVLRHHFGLPYFGDDATNCTPLVGRS